eukprot:13239699-Heterocapsa_arctica.AAC.1
MGAVRAPLRASVRVPRGLRHVRVLRDLPQADASCRHTSGHGVARAALPRRPPPRDLAGDCQVRGRGRLQ